ncbi:MAG: preprotein translocase subunit SecE [Solirubrobacteraceae bacterium]
MARNRKRANRRPARPQRADASPPDAADPRDNGRAEVEPAEQEPEAEAATESVQDEPLQIPQLEFSDEPLEDEPEDSEDEPAESQGGLEDDGSVFEDELEDEPAGYEEDELVEDAPSRPARRGSAPAAEETGTAVVHHRGGPLGRLYNFAQGSWRELQRVQWPDRRQVMQATGVVIGFVVVAGVFLGVADYLAGKLINFILNQ